MKPSSSVGKLDSKIYSTEIINSVERLFWKEACCIAAGQCHVKTRTITSLLCSARRMKREESPSMSDMELRGKI